MTQGGDTRMHQKNYYTMPKLCRLRSISFSALVVSGQISGILQHVHHIMQAQQTVTAVLLSLAQANNHMCSGAKWYSYMC